MDHIGVLKRAWSVTWRYRILWLFGLFAAGGSSGSGGGNFNYSTGASDFDPELAYEMEQAFYWVQDNVVLLIAAVAALFVVGLALFIIGVAAKGGLIHLVNEAEEDRPVRGMDGWAAGFRAWFRLFGIAFVLYLPFMLVLGLIMLAAFAPLIGPLLSGGEPGAESILGMCGGLLIGGLLLIVFGILIGLLDTLASRHAVLGGTGVFSSIGEAWTDVRTRFKDVAVMWLLMLEVGIGYGIVIGVIAAIFGFAVVAALIAQVWPIAIAIGFALFIVMLVPTAIMGAFSSAVWTVFFRRLTGREVVEVRSAAAPPAYAPAPGDDAQAPPSGVMPPAPPAPPAPPGGMPPAPPAPPAPPIAPPAPESDDSGSRE